MSTESPPSVARSLAPLFPDWGPNHRSSSSSSSYSARQEDSTARSTRMVTLTPVQEAETPYLLQIFSQIGAAFLTQTVVLDESTTVKFEVCMPSSPFQASVGRVAAQGTLYQ